MKKIGSTRGTSSHQHSPFVVIAGKDANEDAGDCYGISFLYSGSFNCEVEKDQTDQVRLNMGVQDEMFEYVLYPESEFVAPEVVMVYAPDGFADMSHKMHDVVRYNICRGEYKTKRRPILINSWEAVYFDFNGDDIVNIAKQASELGVEMLVLDDGWFGVRNDDKSGLGDWFVNEDKMGGPMADVVKRVKDLGMKFGIWIEPEMVSEKSELFKEHPDYAFVIPGRKPVMGRSQLNLDFSRKEVVNCIFDQMTAVLDKIDVDYIKMDMNRSILNVYSMTEGIQNNGTILYKYVLGVYDFMERLQARYPKMFIEGCSGGGGRFDAGMMYYTPQIWCSDNTDPIERLFIQWGFSQIFPSKAMSAHVTSWNKKTSVKFRTDVASMCKLGFDLGLKELNADELTYCQNAVANWTRLKKVILDGDQYRLVSPYDGNHMSVMYTAPDKNKAVLYTYDIHPRYAEKLLPVKLQGLDPSKRYKVKEINLMPNKKSNLGANEKTYSGDYLMKIGINAFTTNQAFSRVIELTAE